MRTGSSVSMDVNPGGSQVRPKTSAAKPTRMRGNPRILRKPKRRSSLSSKLIASATLEKAWTLLNSGGVSLRPFDWRLRSVRERTRAEKDTAVSRARKTRREDGAVRRLADAGSIHQHRGRTSGCAKECRDVRYFAHGAIDCRWKRRAQLAEHDVDQQHRQVGGRPGAIHILAERTRRNHRRPDRVSNRRGKISARRKRIMHGRRFRMAGSTSSEQCSSR